MAVFDRSVTFTKHLFSLNRLNTKCFRHYSVIRNVKPDALVKSVTDGRMSVWLKAYENLVGLTAVREAQEKVISAEDQFVHQQGLRREKQQELTTVQTELRAISSKLDKVHRGEERYLTLLTEEHTVLKEENSLSEQLNLLEDDERHKFAVLSSALRTSHERERERTERTKYWSLIGSLVGAFIGIVGTSINNYLRMRQMRNIVQDTADDGVTLREIVTELSGTMHRQHQQLQVFVNDLRNMVSPDSSPVNLQTLSESDVRTDVMTSEQLEKHTKEIMTVVQQQEQLVEREMKDLKQALSIATQSGQVSPDSQGGMIVYVGPEIEDLLTDTEKNLEWKMKVNALWTVTLLYGALALTIPVLYNMFR